MVTEILPELSTWLQRTAKSLFRRSIVHLPALHAAPQQARRESRLQVRLPGARSELAVALCDPFTPFEFMGAAIVSTFAAGFTIEA